MQVSQNVLQQRYTDTVHNQQLVDINNGARNKYDSVFVDENKGFLQDSFVKSSYLQKIEELGDSIEGAFKDTSSFISMANTLKNQNILNSQDLIAANYLVKQTPNASFEAFEKVLRNDNLSIEMKGLITQLLNKLHNINYIHAGLMARVS